MACGLGMFECIARIPAVPHSLSQLIFYIINSFCPHKHFMGKERSLILEEAMAVAH
jgi:hypothetical protein